MIITRSITKHSPFYGIFIFRSLLARLWGKWNNKPGFFNMNCHNLLPHNTVNDSNLSLYNSKKHIIPVISNIHILLLHLKSGGAAICLGQICHRCCAT